MLKRLAGRLDTLYLDADDRRKAGLVSVVLLALFISAPLLYLPAVLINTGQGSPVIFTVFGFVGSAIILGLSLWTLLRQQLYYARRIIVFGLLLMAIMAMVTSAGIENALPAGVIFVYIILTAIVFNLQRTIILSVLYMASAMTVTLLRLDGSNDARMLLTTALVISTAAAAGITVSYITGLSFRKMQSAESQSRSLRALLDLSEIFNATLDIDRMLTSVANSAGKRLGYESVRIYLIDRKTSEASLVAASGNMRPLVKRKSQAIPINNQSHIGEVIISGEPRVVRGDEANILPHGEPGRKIWVGSEAMFPLVINNNVIGVLDVQSADEEAFIGSGFDVLQMLANHMAIALSNARIFASEAALLEASSSIFRAVMELVSASSPQQIVEVLRNVIPAADWIGMVLQFDTDSGGTRYQLAGRVERESLSIAHTDIPDLEELVGARTVVSANLHQDVVITEALRIFGLHKLNAASMLCIPLVVRERPQGYLLFATKVIRPYTEQEIQTLEMLARQIALTQDNLHLIERLNQALEEATTMYTTSMVVNSAQSLQEIYDITLEEVANISGCDRITVYQAGPLLSSEVEYLDETVYWRYGRVSISRNPIQHDIATAPILNQFALSRNNVIFNDIANDERIPVDVRSNYVKENVSALAVVPLTTGTVWLGALLLEANQGQVFTERQVRLCRNVADLTALAINLQLLIQKNRLEAERERGIRAIIENIRASRTPEDIMLSVNTGLSQLLDISQETIQRARLGERSLMHSDDWQVVQEVDRQAQLSIANMSLLERTQSAMVQEQVLGHLIAELGHANAMDEVMQTAAETLRTTLGDFDIRVRLTPQADESGEELQDIEHNITAGE